MITIELNLKGEKDYNCSVCKKAQEVLEQRFNLGSTYYPGLCGNVIRTSFSRAKKLSGISNKLSKIEKELELAGIPVIKMTLGFVDNY